MNRGWILVLTSALALGTAAHAENIITLKASRDLPYGRIAYIHGTPIDAPDFYTYRVYSHKDHCWFLSAPDDGRLGVVKQNEILMVIPLVAVSNSGEIDFRVSRADGLPIGGLRCAAVANPAPESLDDMKAFLQIQFGAGATIQ